MVALMNADQARSGRELIEATRPFAVESRARSWWYVLSGVGALLACAAVTLTRLPFAVRLLAGVVEGLLFVRVFILYHDFIHGSLLRNSKLARVVMYPFGLAVLAPPRVWRETHNYHHAHTMQMAGSHIGSYPVMTVAQWNEASPALRRKYRYARHPLTILFAYFTMFYLEMGLLAFLRAPRKRWDSLLAVIAHAGAGVLLFQWGGFTALLACQLAPLMVATTSGAYLFYAQHNFDRLHIQPRHTWTYDVAALQSSSFMETGPIVGWFTADIGYHHVHHLNPSIPFYRLREAMAAIPELQTPGRTSLSPKEIAACLRLKLWDPQAGKMVGYPQSIK